MLAADIRKIKETRERQTFASPPRDTPMLALDAREKNSGAPGKVRLWKKNSGVPHFWRRPGGEAVFFLSRG